MKIYMNDIMYAFSNALDIVEKEIVGATTYHAQRVAYFSALVGKRMGMSDDELVHLTYAAILHDCALSEYVQHKLIDSSECTREEFLNELSTHCEMGEQLVRMLPFYEDIKGAVLYHHENADGSGPFGKKYNEIPLFARIIHMMDGTDINLKMGEGSEGKHTAVIDFIKENKGTWYDEEIADVFLDLIKPEIFEDVCGDKIISKLFLLMPRHKEQLSDVVFLDFSDFFAKIIDYKSPFTCSHSKGIAQKAMALGKYYGYSEEKQERLYFAGAVHDLGKLYISNEILEKPGKLTNEEFDMIKNHAVGTYVLLKEIEGFSDITRWAALHHEKLDGSGYPFGIKASDIENEIRIMACVDIYQALTEPRPYKDGLPHKKAVEILKDMAAKGQLDERIVNDIDKCFGNHPDHVFDDFSSATADGGHHFTGESGKQNRENNHDINIPIYKCIVCGYEYHGEDVDNIICPSCEMPGNTFKRIN